MTATTAEPRSVRPLPRGTADAVVRRLFPEPSPYQDDPVGFCRDVLRFEPWSKQRDLLNSVAGSRRTAVRSCHGVGKTAAAAAAVIWFHETFPNSRVISTAPTFEPGVKDLLWREIRDLYRRARLPSKPFDTRLERGPLWFAEGYSTDKPERFSGHHAEHLLLVVDEASGVGELIFEAADGFLTNENARVLLIGNPTQLSGTFHKAFHGERDLWTTVHVSAFDAPWATGEPVSEAARRNLIDEVYVDDMRRRYGETSPVYQVRVLGEFPSTTDNTVCALADVEAAQRNDLLVGEPCVIAVDVARFGSDETVIGVRRGPRFRVQEAYAGKDTMETTGRVFRLARDLFLRLRERIVVVVDDVGVGGGVTDRLRELVGEALPHVHVTAFNAGAQAFRPDDYPNRRSEVWFQLAERLPGLDLDPADDALLADLVAPEYGIDSRGRRVVEAKADTKKRLGRSPDRGDALVMAFTVNADESLVELPEPGLSLTGDLLTRAL